MRKFWRAVSSYTAICIVGFTAGSLFWFLVAIGRIRIVGFWKTWQAIRRGRHVIISNHPSMRDPFLLLMMWWPTAQFLPNRFFVWNFPGKNYFTDFMNRYFCSRGWKFPEWVYPVVHAIPVERDGSNRKEVISQTKKVLADKQSIIIFGEARRTGSRNRKNPHAEIEYLVSADGSRKIQPISAVLIKTAADQDATFTTAWIDMPFWEEDPGFGLWTWLRGWHRVTITLGDPYLPDQTMCAKELYMDVARRLLET